MKAFLLAMVLMLVISLGAGFVMDGFLSESASKAYSSSSSTRL